MGSDDTERHSCCGPVLTLALSDRDEEDGSPPPYPPPVPCTLLLSGEGDLRAPLLLSCWARYLPASSGWDGADAGDAGAAVGTPR